MGFFCCLIILHWWRHQCRWLLPVPQIKIQSSTMGTSSLRPLPPRSSTDCPGADWCLNPGLGRDPPGAHPSFHQKPAQMLHMQFVEAKHQPDTLGQEGFRTFVGYVHDFIFMLISIQNHWECHPQWVKDLGSDWMFLHCFDIKESDYKIKKWLKFFIDLLLIKKFSV